MLCIMRAWVGADRQMVCDYDEFSVDTHMSWILKATMALLMRSNVSRARKKELSSPLESCCCSPSSYVPKS